MNVRLIPVTLTLFATALFAQGPHMRGMGMHGGMFGPDAAGKTDQVQSYLKLTDAQIQSLQQIRTAQAAAMKPLFDQMEPLHSALHSQMGSSSADPAAIGKAVLSMQSLHRQMKTMEASYRNQALAVLTAEQKTQLTALQNAASLMPAIHQAMSLNLLTPPEHDGGPGGPEAEQ